MSTVKTATSLNRSLLEHENRKLLVRLDEAYGDEPSADEHELRRRMRRRHRQQVQGTW